MMSMRLSWLAVPVLNTLYQFFIKHGAAQLDGDGGADWLWQALTSHWILAAIAAEILCFFIWMNVLSELDLSRAFPLSGISYVLIIATGWFVFGEPVVGLQVIGSGLILTGVWLIASAAGETSDQNGWAPKRGSLSTDTGKDK
ncbi:EamA family transporter [Rhizobium sp. CB3171]|uniref:EamA family transporter n=1 Tax=unclassified Rhizobium TaxID=2613769 RepID=UPI000CDF545D|nr:MULTISPECIES: EamA family transporter [Rhizobium]AVA23381.1 small multidrug resistance protein [Rhizobium sp. NXC24]MDK4739629.1 EamA family transporter [Rhizobium sp. CNPSo 3464]UWU20728.1 EamA family transporter [Rhizobium tropici]WFU01530.1 EamA family transporter [Rhizobium sp. CB3171]